MNTEIQEFVEGNLKAIAWFAIPGGLIAGEVDMLDHETKVFGLRDATYFTGDVKLWVGDCAVFCPVVSAWGNDLPEPRDENN